MTTTKTKIKTKQNKTKQNKQTNKQNKKEKKMAAISKMLKIIENKSFLVLPETLSIGSSATLQVKQSIFNEHDEVKSNEN